MRRVALLFSPLLGVYVVAMLLLPAREGWAGDEPEYLNLAGNLGSGFYREGTADGPLDMCFPGWTSPDLWYAPGFPAFLAPLVALDLPTSAIRLVGPALLFIAVLLFYRLLLYTVRARIALLGALALGLFVPVYRYLPFLHSEFLALALVVAAMLALTVTLRSGGPAPIAAASACLAWLALARAAYGWVVTALLVVWLAHWALRRSTSSRRLAIVHVLALALCLPWLAYSWSVTGRPAVWATSGSLSAYWMSSPYPADRGDWHCATDVFTVEWLAPHRAFFRTHADASPKDQNRALERQALKNIREHPAKYAQNVAANASRMVFNAPYSRRPLDLRAAFFILPGLLMVSFLALAVTRLARSGWPMPPEGTAFALFAAVAFAVHLPISAYVRMLIPILPALLWLIVYGLVRPATRPGSASSPMHPPRANTAPSRQPPGHWSADALDRDPDGLTTHLRDG